LLDTATKEASEGKTVEALDKFTLPISFSLYSIVTTSNPKISTIHLVHPEFRLAISLPFGVHPILVGGSFLLEDRRR